MSDYAEFESKMKKTLENLVSELDAVRAGRANPAVLSQISVDYYGAPTPIQQIASVSVPDPRSLVIQPWDGSALKSIEKAILASELGINPQNDGRIIRLVFPQLTEERRKELAKQVKKYGEEAKVAIRNIRRDAMKSSSVPLTVAAYRLAAERFDCPLHLGVTETGTSWNGTILSAVGIGTLLNEGIGDTIRVSLTADPVEEVRAGVAILKACGLKKGGVRLISCPTCGRTQIDLISLAREVEEKVSRLDRDITVAVMGCVVNGPGEAREADYGIAGGRDCGLIFKKGEVVGTYPYDQLCARLLSLIESEAGQ